MLAVRARHLTSHADNLRRVRDRLVPPSCRELIGASEYAGWPTINAELVPFFPELVNTVGTLFFAPPLKCFSLANIVEEGYAETAGGHHKINIEIQDLPCTWQGRK